MGFLTLWDRAVVFYRPSAQQSLPSSLTGIEQVATAKLLGITFSQTLSFDEHARTILSICSQRMYGTCSSASKVRDSRPEN